MLKTLYFLAIMLTAIALGAGLAHFFELPNKIGLDAQDYLTVQRNYDDWWIVGLSSRSRSWWFSRSPWHFEGPAHRFCWRLPRSVC
jgi:hypothetical protein